MGIETARDANQLIQDIELELASIRAATSLRRLEDGKPATVERQAIAETEQPLARVIDTFDLSQTHTAPSVPEATPPAPSAEATPKRQTLQQRLASLKDEED